MKNLKFNIFIIIALVQLFIPAKMIFNKEIVMIRGKEYFFKTRPIDPNDPFRGKYMDLGFEENSFKTKELYKWVPGENVYLEITKDINGYAEIQNASKTSYSNEIDFIRGKISYTSTIDSITQEVFVDFPFSRFYMNEFKISDAEKIYNSGLRDSSIVTFAKVWVKEGDAVIEDLIVGDKSIKDIVK